LLQQLVRQLVERGNHAIKAKFADLYDQYHDARNTRPSLEEFLSMLRDTVDRFSKVYFVVDALDERAEDECGETLLANIQMLQQPKICLLATSRSEPTLECDSQFISRLHIRACEEDISKYIESRIHSSKFFRGVIKRDPDFENDIKKTIITKADGM
jgi:hypothetical protein